MRKKQPEINRDLARKKALETLLADTKSTVEDKVAALRTVQTIDTEKLSAALSGMMKKD